MARQMRGGHLNQELEAEYVKCLLTLRESMTPAQQAGVDQALNDRRYLESLVDAKSMLDAAVVQVQGDLKR